MIRVNGLNKTTIILLGVALIGGVHSAQAQSAAVPAPAIPMLAGPADATPSDTSVLPVPENKSPAPAVPESAPTATAAPAEPSSSTPDAFADVATPPAPSENELNASSSTPSLAEEIGAAMGEDKFPGLDLPVDEKANARTATLTPEQESNKMRQDAYELMMSGLLPLSPDELRDSFERVDRNQKAIEEPLKFPKPEVAFTTVSIDPGATPLTFKLATDHVTTVTFLDITGAPWPIQDVSWAGHFEVKAPTNSNTDERLPTYPNVLRLMPMAAHAYGNMSIRLAGLSTPITFTLRTNQDVVQYRLDIRVPEMGPLATPPLIEGSVQGLTAGDATLTQVMEGVVPNSAEKLAVSGVDGRTTVYRLNGNVYVRTPLTLLSPGWSASVRSADGMNVYAVSDAPVLLLSDNGQMVRAHVSESQGGQE